MKRFLLAVSAVVAAAAVAWAYTTTWNSSFEASPADTDNVSDGASKIRQLKTAIRERMEKDHYFSISGTDADHGEHKQVTLRESSGHPSSAVDKGFLYAIDHGGVTELYYRDSAGNAIRLTDGGYLNLSAGEAGGVAADNIANGAVTNAKLASLAVATGNIQLSAITDSRLADGNVTEPKIGSGAVTESKLGAGAVTNAKIAAGAVTADKISSGLVHLYSATSTVSVSSHASYTTDHSFYFYKTGELDNIRVFVRASDAGSGAKMRVQAGGSVVCATDGQDIPNSTSWLTFSCAISALTDNTPTIVEVMTKDGNCTLYNFMATSGS